ncbi:MAG: J domain-containing protein [Phormidium sp. BM_Day4_Bin.17]|nr:J domain-containing protein [Phormidium sp. BM_Day4_Bin.17]UCJ10594.1 MAG: J domain-containing protein [Phormidium sp. PBR-2020]
MTQHRAQSNPHPLPDRLAAIGKNYYGLLGLHPSASVIEIRQAYRKLSKRYHPDTTTLPPHIAKGKFQQLNEAYATLSNPERRAAYDLNIRYSRIPVMQPGPPLNRPPSPSGYSPKHAYLDPIDRPLSPGELFALLLMGASLLGCLLLAIAIAIWRGDPL